MKIRSILLSLLAAVAVQAQDAPTTFEVSALKFTRPTEWAWVPVSSPMRKAQLAVPGKEGEKAAELTFFYFGGGNTGGVDANVNRWFGQFSGKADAQKRETVEVEGVKVTYATTEGTYTAGMVGGPATALENYALLGAIIEHKDGAVFAKMTGPIGVVKGADAKFREFISAAAKTGK